MSKDRDIELFQQKHHIRGDAQKLEKAVRAGWNVTQRVKDKVRKRMMEILETTEDARAAARIGRVMMLMDQVDIVRAGGVAEPPPKAPDVHVTAIFGEVGRLGRSRTELHQGLPEPDVFEEKADE